jgi:hypothetical protein
MICLFAGFGFDTCLTVIGMHSAERAVLFEYQSLRVVLFVLIAGVVPALALGAGQPEPTIFCT